MRWRDLLWVAVAMEQAVVKAIPPIASTFASLTMVIQSRTTSQ